MKNFVFHNPTTVLFGRETVKRVGIETAALGSRSLLVYGRKNAKESGLYDTVHNYLLESGINIVEHHGVRPNPILDHVREGINLAKIEKIDSLVAIGGGSVIDTAKAISAGTLVEHDVWKFFTGKKSIKKTLPLVCIPTLAGSGSELNGGMVVTNEEKNLKFGIGNRFLHPKVAILDPCLTFSAPSKLTAYGAVDAIMHVLEFYCTTPAIGTVVQDEFIEGLIRALMKSCEQALAKPDDYQARANLMWGSALALSGLPAAGLGRVGFPMHMIEHSLSALYDVPHGAGLAVIAPGWLSWQAEQSSVRIAKFSRNVLGVQSAANTLKQAYKGIDLFRDWLAAQGCPVILSELGVPKEDLPNIAENCLPLAKLWRLKNYNQETIEAILHRCC